jgi:hypothetical protein
MIVFLAFVLGIVFCPILIFFMLWLWVCCVMVGEDLEYESKRKTKKDARW